MSLSWRVCYSVYVQTLVSEAQKDVRGVLPSALTCALVVTCFRMQTRMESCRRRVNSVYGFVQADRPFIAIVGIVGMLSTLLALVPVVSAEFDQCARPSGVWVGYDQVSACMT